MVCMRKPENGAVMSVGKERSIQCCATNRAGITPQFSTPRVRGLHTGNLSRAVQAQREVVKGTWTKRLPVR